ncbi:hypothetical protein GF420_10960, partial [candidate division GN15 bacterium]|nr:hypothetical protein [candidate division GN15 bacterium]
HIDASSRLQTVRREDNALLYDLLQAFEQKTGVPVLLNTSFNLRGHPIVHTPEQAFATFVSGGIDVLVLGRYLIDKRTIPDELTERFRFEKAYD